MTRRERRPDRDLELRRRADEIARKEAAAAPENVEAVLPEEIRRMLHELRVHQIELEMQNEELREAQVELDASRTRYFDLYDLAPVGYCTLSEKGEVLEANLTAADLLNVSRGALVQRSFSRFVLAADQDIYYRLRQCLVETREPQVCELRIVRANGPALWVRLDATAGWGEGGAPVYRVVLSDISERRRAEEESENLQAQLNQARKMESIGRLAGGVAHDFNNMLAVILGNTELAMAGLARQDPLHDALQEILEATQHSAEVTRQLLAFARKQIISPKVLDLNETVAEMLKMLRRLIGEDLELSFQPAASVWPVKMDPSQIDQILANLCVNSRDAIADIGSVTVETANVSLEGDFCAKHTGFVPGDYALLTVRDDGRGMDQQTLDNLFEPFFTTKEADKGTGLGLAMVYGIVKQNRGFIDVASEPGKGATFEIYLPRYGAAEGVVRERTGPVGLASRGSETILVVEDQPAVLRVSSQMLEHLGYTVLTASTPGEAIRLTEAYSGEIHLLLTDVTMPEMNGRDLAKRLLAVRPHLKRLFMSGYPANIAAEGGVLDAGIEFIQKPFSVGALAVSVRQALQRD